MSPRPYTLGQREARVEHTRTRILSAARDVLATEDRLTVDAVARAADVARMTVYNQFGSKSGLLDALFDWLAERGGMHQLASAFQQADPELALERFVRVMCGFWASDRDVMRRVRALAALDPELQALVGARDQWRRQGVRTLLDRRASASPDTIDLVHALTSFETFDSLAGADRAVDAVTLLVSRAVRAVLA
jgi:AcrR family transcriptional regulator